TVLFVACLACIAAIAATKFVPSLKALLKTSKTQSNALRECQCGKSCGGKLNKFLLFVFPPKVYLDYGVENLKPYIDEEAQAKKAARKEKKQSK
ncbi:MAG: hypothetical protein OSJ68_05265, partial [Clostridia bacterium]|nr:hypothetical protein [Clostridia bacterium]